MGDVRGPFIIVITQVKGRYICMTRKVAALLLALASNVAVAQPATVNFSNRNLNTNAGDTLVRFAGSLAPVSGTNYIAVLLYGREDNSLVAHPTFAPFRSPAFAPPGFWNGGVRTLNGFDFAPAEIARLQVAVFDAKHFGSYDAAVAGQGILGRSAVFDYIIPVPPYSPVSFDIVNFRRFTIVPEPSAIGLGVIVAFTARFVTRGRRKMGGWLLALEAVHGGALEFAVGVALFDVLAFVELDFAFADREGHFHFAVFPVEGEGEERVALD